MLNNFPLKVHSIAMTKDPLYFAAKPGTNFGWGICNRHLLDETSKLTPVIPLENEHELWNSQSLPGPLFLVLQNQHFDPYTPARGKNNYGYTFFENELSPRSKVNAERLDVVLGGSSWCCEKMSEIGIKNSAPLIQGVNTDIFRPSSSPFSDDQFLIFSGGKFELRKGQDLILRAIQILQQKYKDIVLVNAWYNIWTDSMKTMGSSRHIRFELCEGSYQDQMTYLYTLNGLDPSRIRTLPLMPHEKMARIYQQTHLGLFPNRCEGGTNLVMMEYMACGKPVIASYGTGHKDVLNEKNALLLKNLKGLNIHTPDGEIAARWLEPSLDEIISQIEYAYNNRTALTQIAQKAGEEMAQFTWERMAKTLLKHIYN
jgi:glycosyltransferase involved in cell wall biosynthesis